MAEKDACIALCQAWHASDVQALRARHTAMLADVEDRQQAKLAAAVEQQQADMHAAQQADAQKAANQVQSWRRLRQRWSACSRL